MNKILRIQYDALSLTNAFFYKERWVDREQVASLFNEFRMKLLSSMGLPPRAGQGCDGPVESYEYGLEFYPTDSVIVQGDPKNLDLLLIKAAPHRVYLTWEEIELPESLKQLYNLNTQENTTMTKSKQIPIPYFTASGKQYWYDPATDRVGVGETLHAKGKTTFLFAVSLDSKGKKTRAPYRHSVHISTIREFAKKQEGHTSETSSFNKTGAWPQPASTNGEIRDQYTPASGVAELQGSTQGSTRLALESKIDSLTATVVQLTTKVTVLTDRLASFDGFIRK